MSQIPGYIDYLNILCIKLHYNAKLQRVMFAICSYLGMELEKVRSLI